MQQKNIEAGMDIYDRLNALPLFNGEVIFDDRIKERPHMKLRSANMFGIPYTIVIGKDFIEKGVLEIFCRRANGNSHILMAIEDAMKLFKKISDSISNNE